MEDHVVVFGLQEVRKPLGKTPLVKALLDPVNVGHVEPAGEGQQSADGPARDRHDQPAVHAAREVRSDLHVADQLPLDGPAEPFCHRIGQLRVPRQGRIGRRKAAVITARSRGRSHARRQFQKLTRREQQDVFEKGLGSEEILKGKVLHQGSREMRGRNSVLARIPLISLANSR